MIDLGLKWEAAGADYDILRTVAGTAVGHVKSTQGGWEAWSRFDHELGHFGTSTEARFHVEVSVLKKAKEVAR